MLSRPKLEGVKPPWLIIKIRPRFVFSLGVGFEGVESANEKKPENSKGLMAPHSPSSL
jgi:hypothetical protein